MVTHGDSHPGAGGANIQIKCMLFLPSQRVITGSGIDNISRSFVVGKELLGSPLE